MQRSVETADFSKRELNGKILKVKGDTLKFRVRTNGDIEIQFQKNPGIISLNNQTGRYILDARLIDNQAKICVLKGVKLHDIVEFKRYSSSEVERSKAITLDVIDCNTAAIKYLDILKRDFDGIYCSIQSFPGFIDMVTRRK